MSGSNERVVLCVDDDATVLQALRILLSKNLGNHYLVEIAESGEEALSVTEELQAQHHDVAVVIADYIMPGMRGDELLVKLHVRHPNTLKILLTGQSDVDGVKRAINEAHLYRFLEKPFDNEDILLTTRSALHAFEQDKTLQQQHEQLKRFNTELEALVAAKTAELTAKNLELQKLSITDRLTGLYNRLKLDQVLEDEHQRGQRYGTPLALIMVDIDHFKAVNDQHGHQVGDQVLVEIARLLREHVRATDAVGRWGGEEFLIVCRETERDGAHAVAEKLRQLIDAHSFPTLGHLSASFGVSARHNHTSIDELIARADQALYRAKQAGRNRVESET